MLRILHLSDLHFRNINIAQDVVLSSLLRKINEIFSDEKPNVFIITGDIAYSGKVEEYKKAKDYLTQIVQNCEIDLENVFIIPGNHDVDRDKIEKGEIDWWYSFQDESQLLNVLNSKTAFKKITEKFYGYEKFCEDLLRRKTIKGKYGEFVSEIRINGSKVKINIVGLNSSLFCGYDGDDEKKLAIGLEQINSCENVISPEKEIVITCLHHPIRCYHSCEKATINTIKRISDIILLGHDHEAENLTINDGSTSTNFIHAGSSFEKRESENSFDVIELDLENLNGQVTHYKYLPAKHIWVLNKDINQQSDGIFNFKINKTKNTSIKLKSESLPTHNYVATLNLKFSDLNRFKIEEILVELKKITGDNNISLLKLEKGSVRIYFKTNKSIADKDLFDVINDTEKTGIIDIKEIENSKNIHIDKSIYHWRTFLKPDFYERIKNPGASFEHSRVEELELKDLYVEPNCVEIKLDQSEKKIFGKVFNTSDILQKRLDEPMNIVIYGNEESGKSTLLRWIYDKYYENGFLPILIAGNTIKDIKFHNIIKLIQKEFDKQYVGKLEGNLLKFDADRIILIIDDFHKIPFKKNRYRANLLFNLKQFFKNLVLTENTIYQFSKYTTSSGISKYIIEDFQKYQLIEFGPKLRYELINKWNLLGRENITPNELIRLNTDTVSHVDSIIGKNLVPSYPIYILTILQAKELNSSQKFEFSIHAFYYELLINEALSKAIKDKDNISLFYNFITEYCFFLFNNKIRKQPLSFDKFVEFHDKYCEDYKVSLNYEFTLDVLLKSNLVKIEDNSIIIIYAYVYYYFVARYLANNIYKPEIRKIITLLCERVHRDEFANLLIFLTHVSKDELILNELLKNSKSIFNEFSPAQLEDDVSFINKMIKELPEQIFEPVNIVQAKEEDLKEEDELEQQEREFDPNNDIYEYDLNENLSTLDIISKLVRAVKSIDILGQVTKKYWGELKADQKYDLANETYMLGLRTLKFYFSLLDNDNDILIDYIKKIHKKDKKNEVLTKEEIKDASTIFLFGLCVRATFAIIKRITDAIGYDKLSGTFEDILKENNFNSVKLIDLSIKFDYNEEFPFLDLKKLNEETTNQFLPNVVLRQLVVYYMRIYHTSISEKQKLSSILGIKIDEQRLLDVESSIKKQ